MVDIACFQPTVAQESHQTVQISAECPEPNLQSQHTSFSSSVELESTLRPSHCIPPIMLSRKVDARCDELAIVINPIKLTMLAMVNGHGKIFTNPEFWIKSLSE